MDLKKKVVEFCQKFYLDPYGRSHVRRYIETFLFFYPKITEKISKYGKIKILDLGSPGKSHLIETIEHFLGEQYCEYYSEDLRYEFKPELLRGAPYDIILCTEVLEHINERHDSYRGTFTYHGMIIMLRESAKILKPDGIIVLTTPNVCDWVSIYNILHYEHPFNYKPHVRELSDKEFHDNILSKTSLKIVIKQVIDVWIPQGDRKIEIDKIRDCLVGLGYSDKERGDDLMYILTR
jgi:hypothetical protein